MASTGALACARAGASLTVDVDVERIARPRGAAVSVACHSFVVEPGERGRLVLQQQAERLVEVVDVQRLERRRSTLSGVSSMVWYQGESTAVDAVGTPLR